MRRGNLNIFNSTKAALIDSRCCTRYFPFSADGLAIHSSYNCMLMGNDYYQGSQAYIDDGQYFPGKYGPQPAHLIYLEVLAGAYVPL